MTALGVVTTPLNSGAAVLFVYVAAIAGVRESRRIALRWFIGLTVVLCVLVSFFPVPLPQRLWGLGATTGVHLDHQPDPDGTGGTDREAAELRLRDAGSSIWPPSPSANRWRQGVHDLLGHSLTSMIMHAQLLSEPRRGGPGASPRSGRPRRNRPARAPR